MDLPEVVEADLRYLCRELRSRGYDIKVVNVGPMHSYQVSASGPLDLLITCDRGQFSLDGDRRSLDRHGLWRAYDDSAQFERAVLEYVDEARLS